MPVAAGCSGGGGSEGAESDSAELLQEGLDAHLDGDAEAATPLYRKAIERDANNAYAYYNLGLIDQEADRPVQAEEWYRKALAADPNLAPALFNLAILRTQAAAFDEALSLYQRASVANPESASTFLNLGLLLDQLGRTAEAEQALTTATQLDASIVTRLNAAPRQ